MNTSIVSASNLSNAQLGIRFLNYNSPFRIAIFSFLTTAESLIVAMIVAFSE